MKENKIQHSRGLPIIGHSISFYLDALSNVTRLQRKYGDVFSMNVLNRKVNVFLSPKVTRDVFLDIDDNFSSELGWSFSIGPAFKNGLMLRDFDDHKYHRGIMQHAFRRGALEEYIKLMNPLITTWISSIKSKKKIDLYQEVKSLTLDIAFTVFFGESNEDGKTKMVNHFTNAIRSATTPVRLNLPLTGYSRGIKAREELMKYFVEQYESIESRDNRKDLFYELCTAKDEDGNKLSAEDVAQHMIFLLLAAHDTTTSTITNSLWFLAEDQKWKNKIIQESIETNLFDITSLKKAELMEALFKESIRLYPPVPISPRGIVRDCTISNYKLEKDSIIAVSPLQIHRDPRHWTDPDIFLPERFMESYDDGVYFPFAGGAHTCLGKFFASYMFKNIVGNFVKEIEFEREVEDVEISTVPIPFPKSKMLVSVNELN